MIIGTAFTLFVVPAVYTLVAKVHRREVIPVEAASDPKPAVA